MKRLKTRQVIIIGGKDVVSDKVVKQLSSTGMSTKERIYGADRFDTSINVSKQLAPKNCNAYVIKNEDWISGIAISPIASSEQAPIIYGSNAGIKREGVNTLKKNGIKNFDILGLFDNIDYVYDTEVSLTGDWQYTSSVNMNRILGNNSTDLNNRILNQYKDKFNFNTVYIVSNKSFADGLCVSVLAGNTSSPIFVAGNNNIKEIEKYIESNIDKIHNVKIIGGENIIPDSLMDEVYKNATVK